MFPSPRNCHHTSCTNMEVKGKTALVTGASSGIGLAFTRLFLGLGGNVVGADISAKVDGHPLEKEFPGRFMYIQCDVSNFKNLEAAFNFAIEKFGAIDVVLNNAGISGSAKHQILSKKPITEEDVREWDRVIRIDLDGVVYGTALAIRMISKPGVILNVASMAGLIPMASGPEYAAAKHGVVGLTRSVHDALRKQGVRAYAVCPSFTKTGLTSQAIAESKEFQAVVHAVSRGKGMLDANLVAQSMIDLLEKDPGRSQNKVVLRITFEKGVDFQLYGKL
eukprot:TRINITY_DN5775_c0_g1_i1.p1 TRINITY_DN5775_c0_g1~~TRINITY_DN5775_c0_g1_i1.p1  ORF type:complete len:278 (-),score=85.94 TRINITY_DN5775_c0_g1_i1:105-938(-)